MVDMRLNIAEALDIASKILTIASLIAYQLGYIDIGTFITIISAIATLMASLLLHKHSRAFRRFIRRLLKPTVIWVKTPKGDLIIDRGCKICRHPRRAEIEKMLLEGKTYKEIVEAFNNEFSIASLSRHLRLHMPRLILDPDKLNELYREHRVKQIDLEQELLKQIARLEELYEKLEKIDQRFFTDRPKVSPHAFVESVRERRNILADIRETMIAIRELESEVKTEKDLSELLQRLREMG